MGDANLDESSAASPTPSSTNIKASNAPVGSSQRSRLASSVQSATRQKAIRSASSPPPKLALTPRNRVGDTRNVVPIVMRSETGRLPQEATGDQMTVEAQPKPTPIDDVGQNLKDHAPPKRGRGRPPKRQVVLNETKACGETSRKKTNQKHEARQSHSSSRLAGEKEIDHVHPKPIALDSKDGNERTNTRIDSGKYVPSARTRLGRRSLSNAGQRIPLLLGTEELDLFNDKRREERKLERLEGADNVGDLASPSRFRRLSTSIAATGMRQEINEAIAMVRRRREPSTAVHGLADPKPIDRRTGDLKGKKDEHHDVDANEMEKRDPEKLDQLSEDEDLLGDAPERNVHSEKSAREPTVELAKYAMCWDGADQKPNSMNEFVSDMPQAARGQRSAASNMAEIDEDQMLDADVDDRRLNEDDVDVADPEGSNERVPHAIGYFYNLILDEAHPLEGQKAREAKEA